MTAAADAVPWRHLGGGVYLRLLGPLADDPAVGRLLDRCARGDRAPHELRVLVGRDPQVAEALRRLVAEEERAGREAAAFAGGVLDAVACLPPEEAVPLLTRAAEQESGLTRGSLPLARRAIRALAEVPGELVPPALHRLAAESPRSELRRAAYARLKQRLSTLSDAPEWPVERFGLDAAGRTRITVGPRHTAVVQVAAGGRVTVVYHGPNGRALSSKPTASSLDPTAMDDVARLADALRAAIRAARTRLESAQREGREIPTADWLEHYMEHPVTGAVARTLLWELRRGDGWRIGLPRKDGKRWYLVALDRELVLPQDGDMLRVLLPKHLTRQDTKVWRQFLARARIQPSFPQSELR